MSKNGIFNLIVKQRARLYHHLSNLDFDRGLIGVVIGFGESEPHGATSVQKRSMNASGAEGVPGRQFRTPSESHLIYPKKGRNARSSSAGFPFCCGKVRSLGPNEAVSLTFATSGHPADLKSLHVNRL